MDAPQLLALAAALGWASGLRLYAAGFLVGAAGYLGWMDLPQGLHLLQQPAVLAASGFMCFVEFFADKIPLVDSLWDVVHTVIRIPAGAALAASHPAAFAVALVLTLAVAAVLMVVLFKFLRAVGRRVAQFFGRTPSPQKS